MSGVLSRTHPRNQPPQYNATPRCQVRAGVMCYMYSPRMRRPYLEACASEPPNPTTLLVPQSQQIQNKQVSIRSSFLGHVISVAEDKIDTSTTRRNVLYMERQPHV
ncbi:hypothetical protein F5Y18DRAFT_164490 [Xylariaceae sp. FL1019]|nr:hypothetical protein F5Y18DRAFT_164490 [Xylariaceae sp. FL1019]